jgi:tRNA modification GTPase
VAKEPRVASPALRVPVVHVRILTPLAAGAIAVIQVAGPQALSIAQTVFRPRSGKMLGEYPPNRLAYGDLLDGDGTVLDDGLALHGTAADGGPWAEFHVHGGVRIVQRLIRRLTNLGAHLDPTAPNQTTSWKESLGGPADRSFEWLCPLDRWVQECLAAAATARVVQWLVGQGGAWRHTVADWRVRVSAGDIDSVRLEAEEILSRAASGSLWRGRTLAIIGLPNAGKSSIANRLAGQNVSLVATAPGTTRDWVGQQIALGGWPVLLVDTAGLRVTDDPVEAEGVLRAVAQTRRADLRLLVIDRSCAPSDSEGWLVEQVGLQSIDTIAYAKCDLPAGRPPCDGLAASVGNARTVQVSSLTGAGWSELERVLLDGFGSPALQDLQPLVFCGEMEAFVTRLASVLGARERNRALSVLDDLAPAD